MNPVNYKVPQNQSDHVRPGKAIQKGAWEGSLEDVSDLGLSKHLHAARNATIFIIKLEHINF